MLTVRSFMRFLRSRSQAKAWLPTRRSSCNLHGTSWSFMVKNRSELEEVVERFAAAVGRRRGRWRRPRLALDGATSREQRAVIGRVLRTHASADDLAALECRARIERVTLIPRMLVHTALAALAQ